MLTKSEKREVVEGLIDRFRRQRVSIFADFHGISVAKLSALRRELKKLGAEFKVAKKTLLKRALEASGAGGIEPKELAGEIGVIFGYEDQIAPAKAAAKFAKGNETFKVLKGILAGKVLEAKEVLALAKLPSREQLLTQLAYALHGPIQGLAMVLQGNIRNLVVVLHKINEQKPKG
ncbi:MAG: 50S ribosomal protein L10 [Patescibacteria group bacterium]